MGDLPESSLSSCIETRSIDSSDYDRVPVQINFCNLSTNLEQILLNPCFSDAVILIDGAKFDVHRCILAARSAFFREIFRNKRASDAEEEKPELNLTDLKVSSQAFTIVLTYMYTGKLKHEKSESSSCADYSCDHETCQPAIGFYVELMYAASIFQLPELFGIYQNTLMSLLEKCDVEDTFPILIAAHDCNAPSLFAKCEEKILRSELDILSAKRALREDVAQRLKLMHPEDERIKRIHKALATDDVELMKQLMTESGLNMNDTYALHYAVANCDSKVVDRMLALNEVDINLRNTRGYTALHIAALRREPYIILSLLEKGACASDLTYDGRSAPTICRRITALKDAQTQGSREINKYRLCISVLEGQMYRGADEGQSDVICEGEGGTLHYMLLHFEIRVSLARMWYPTEARLAMELANAHQTVPYDNVSARMGVSNPKDSLRLEALVQTVRNGRRYFSSCAYMIDQWIRYFDTSF